LTPIANLGDDFDAWFAPLDFSITDGNVTFTKSEFPNVQFFAETNSTGNLIAWFVGVQNGQEAGSVSLFTNGGPPGFGGPRDEYELYLSAQTVYAGPVFAQAYSLRNPGVWTVQAFTTTPEPGTGWLMLMAIPMLILVMKKVARS
jgi:hypothetical protein